MITMTVTLSGDTELLGRLSPAITAQPKRRFLMRSTSLVADRARINATPNIDTGAGVGSIKESVKGDTGTVEVGERRMIFVHEGTKPHFPPIAAVTPWANRHGIDPFLVAYGISIHGTKANPFLADAFDQSLGEIEGYVGDMALEIEQALGS